MFPSCSCMCEMNMRCSGLTPLHHDSSGLISVTLHLNFVSHLIAMQATDKTAYCYMRTMLMWVAAQSACGC